ncbi:SPRY domain-containing protein 3 isoform X3 [Hypomesus transpacificus]|uniref:SPRY domain-containing protein 3 isoform X3 n=1 Tax=Hypomesus transpacificus TaxID=137520 RepID=UPI001F07A18D|nr:SPRY domain-containing protein 3 isoform X3 [Hypomesus transpacificus]
MDDINLQYRFLNWRRRRIRDIGEVRAVRVQERYKRMLKDGDILSYQGNSDEVGCYVAPYPLSKGNCYFEVTILDTGVRGTIAVGLVPQGYKLDHQPGWLPHSIAYHADDGKLYNGNPVGQQFGPKCNRGDRIGCGIYLEPSEASLTTVFFTKNGKEVGSAVVPVSAEGLFPSVGMHSLGEEVKVDLQAEWATQEDDSRMMVDGQEDEWGRLHDVRVSHTDYPKNRHPGWSRGSVAYHADDGQIFHGSGAGDAFGPRCVEGDIMGCGIMFPRDYILDDEDDIEEDPDPEPPEGAEKGGFQNVLYQNGGEEEEEEEEEEGDEMERGNESRKVVAFFTRNGKLMGRRQVAVPPGGLYPTIGMLSSGEKVKVDLHPLSG